MLAAYRKKGDIESASKLWKMMIESDVKPDLKSYAAILGVYGRGGNHEGVQKYFTEMKQAGKAYLFYSVFIFRI